MLQTLRVLKTVALCTIGAHVVFSIGCATPTTRRAEAAAPGPLAPVSFIAGDWSGENDGTTFEERWNQPTSNLMSATGRLISGGKTVFHEYLRIVAKGEGLVYIAQPAGRPPTEFELTRSEPGMAQFENPGHDFPKLIRYSIKGDVMTAFLEGTESGRPKTETFVMRRVRPR